MASDPSANPVAQAVAAHAASDYLKLIAPRPTQSDFLSKKKIRGAATKDLFAQYVKAGLAVITEVDPSSPYFADALAAQVKGAPQSEAKPTTADSAPVVAAKAADDTPNTAAPASGSTTTGTAPPTPDPNAPAAQANANVTPADPISYLQSTGISSSSRATLLTEEVLSGYATLGKSDTFVLGFKAVASLPAGSPTNTYYVTAELLELNGGILNFYLSPLARSPKNWAQQSSHLYDTDKFYFRPEPQLDSLLAYMRDGIGIRGYRPAATSTSGSTVTLEPIGTGYFALGADGTAFDAASTTTGTIGAEAFASVNVANKTLLDHTYSTTAARTAFGTWGANFSLSLDQYVIKAFYAMPLGPTSRTRSFAANVAGLSVTYNKKQAGSQAETSGR